MRLALTEAIQQLRRLAQLSPGDGDADGDLLGRFIRHQDGPAFEALVRRHGPLVLGVCRRVLRNEAEDAFQATFLVLVSRARSIRKPASLACWLHGVARRSALYLKRAAARRRAQEARVMPRAEVQATTAGDLREVLDQELAGLPAKYRAAVVLCDLENRSRKEAARELGCAEGTVASRLARGRQLLARRLARQGVSLAVGAMGVGLIPEASADVPAVLVVSTVRAATSMAAGQAMAAPLPAIMEGVLRIMLLQKLRHIAAVLLLLVLLAGSTGLVWSAAQSRGENGPEGKAAQSADNQPATAVGASEISRSYLKNDASGDEQFFGKRVRVSGYMGEVRRVWKSGRPYYFLTMFHVPNGGSILPPTFEFSLEARKELAPLKPRQGLTIEGRCDGREEAGGDWRESILFRNCRIVSVGPAPEQPGGNGGAGKSERGRKGGSGFPGGKGASQPGGSPPPK
jgi:RNA polymerase sigma factor (sigma-70 family)